MKCHFCDPLELWLESGHFFNAQWNKFIDLTGDNKYNMYVYGTTIYGNLLYWLFGFTYLFFDITGKPDFIRRYKMQPGSNEPVDPARLSRVFKQVFINQFVVGLVSAMMGYSLLDARGTPDIRILPSFWRMAIDILVFVALREVSFYYFHRMMHHKLIYKHIHKRHHEWTAPIALTTAYAHPIEHILCNITPIFVGPLVMGSHLATTWLWLLNVTNETMAAHSGYHFPLMPISPEGHDYHHLKFNNFFGILGVLDYLHGTDEQFRQTKSFKRHSMLRSLKSARELIPDD